MTYILKYSCRNCRPSRRDILGHRSLNMARNQHLLGFPSEESTAALVGHTQPACGRSEPVTLSFGMPFQFSSAIGPKTDFSPSLAVAARRSEQPRLPQKRLEQLPR